MKWSKIVFFLTGLNVLLSCWWLFSNNLIINFDVSRDLMILWDIVENRHLTLIGGHSGTIPRVFHGPLWYYVNLPVFFLSFGNPLLLGWFWVSLSIITLIIIYLVGRNLFDKKTALLSVLVFSANSITNSVDESKYFYNPYGAVMLFPGFFLLFYRYTQNFNPKILFLSLLILGLIIQFQMAFGVPILILTLLYLFFFTYKKNYLKHLFTLPVLLFPLSTFIFFELRHDFLQSKKVLEYIFTKHPTEMNNWIDFAASRFDSLILDNFRMLLPNNFPLQVFFSLVFFMLLVFVLTGGKKVKNLLIFQIFSYFYIGFCIITFFFRGEIVNYYWPFLPLIVILLGFFLNDLSKKISFIILGLLIITNLYYSLKVINTYNPNIESHSFDSWDYNHKMARTIYADAEEDFGFYIFTPNLFGYSQRYAIEYTGKEYSSKKAIPFQKKKLTYLIVVYPPKDRPDLNPDLWRISDIKITGDTVKTLLFKDYRIEKYQLSENDIKLPSNPTLFLLNNLYFR